MLLLYLYEIFETLLTTHQTFAMLLAVDFEL